MTFSIVVAWPGSGNPPMFSPAPRSVWVTPSIAASLAGWFAATVRPSRSPTADLQRREDRRHRERYRDRLAVIGVAPAAQHPDRIDAATPNVVARYAPKTICEVSVAHAGLNIAANRLTCVTRP